MKITFVIFSKKILTSKFLFFASLGHHVFLLLLYQMEEGKREDEGEGTGGQALAMREPNWCTSLVVTIY